MPWPPSIAIEKITVPSTAASTAPRGTTVRSPRAGERRDRRAMPRPRPAAPRRCSTPAGRRRSPRPAPRRGDRSGPGARDRTRRACGASTCSGCSLPPVGHAVQPAAVDPDLHDAREDGPRHQAPDGHDPGGRAPLRQQRDHARDRVVAVQVDVEPGQHDDHERGRERVLDQPDQGADEHLPRDADAARLEHAQQRRRQRLGERHTDPRRPDDRDRLEHRRQACPVSPPRATQLAHAGERDAARKRDAEPDRRHRARGKERYGGHMRQARGLLSGTGALAARAGRRFGRGAAHRLTVPSPRSPPSRARALV